MRRIYGTKSVFLTIGVHAEEGAAKKRDKWVDAAGVEHNETDEKTTLVQVATVHEYGLGVPERSFLRAWFDEEGEKAKEAFRRVYEAVIAGKYDAKTGLERLGLAFVGRIQNRISKGIEPELADVTIKRKRSSKPLINTGQLRSSIRHRLDLRK